jgi:hypothetical protein
LGNKKGAKAPCDAYRKPPYLPPCLLPSLHNVINDELSELQIDDTALNNCFIMNRLFSADSRESILQQSVNYEPITPPSFLVTITVAERGRAPLPSGQLLVNFPTVERSPGCWMFTNIVFISGVLQTPVTS